ncbi:histidinol dehydrogenase 1, partial [Aspergillus flavus]
MCPEQTIADIKEVQRNVRTFAEAQKNSLKDFEIEVQPGVHLGQRNLLGSVPAVAAIAVGTETIRKVDFLAGTGNRFVAEGKRQLFGEVGIDLFAGPTEVLVLADETADPFTVAMDLISQAGHGPDTPAVLITTCPKVGRETIEIVNKLLSATDLSTPDVAKVSWDAFGE